MAKLTKLKKEYQENGFANMDYDDGKPYDTDDTHTVGVQQKGDILIVTLQATITWNRYTWLKKPVKK
jgi:hypothetical protein